MLEALCSNLKPQIVIAHELGYLQKADFEKLDAQTERIAKAINALLDVVRGETGKKPEVSKSEILLSIA
jgi:hypothetical protein